MGNGYQNRFTSLLRLPNIISSLCITSIERMLNNVTAQNVDIVSWCFGLCCVTTVSVNVKVNKRVRRFRHLGLLIDTVCGLL